MKPEEQLIALLTWMGWKIRWSEANGTMANPSGSYVGEPPSWWENPLRNLSKEWRIPPLTCDLMFTAEERLLGMDGDAPYAYDMKWLPEVTGAFNRDAGLVNMVRLWHATKEQRLEALLKTLKLWKQ